MYNTRATGLANLSCNAGANLSLNHQRPFHDHFFHLKNQLMKRARKPDKPLCRHITSPVSPKKISSEHAGVWMLQKTRAWQTAHLITFLGIQMMLFVAVSTNRYFHAQGFKTLGHDDKWLSEQIYKSINAHERFC